LEDKKVSAGTHEQCISHGFTKQIRVHTNLGGRNRSVKQPLKKRGTHLGQEHLLKPRGSSHKHTRAMRAKKSHAFA